MQAVQLTAGRISCSPATLSRPIRDQTRRCAGLSNGPHPISQPPPEPPSLVPSERMELSLWRDAHNDSDCCSIIVQRAQSVFDRSNINLKLSLAFSAR